MANKRKTIILSLLVVLSLSSSLYLNAEIQSLDTVSTASGHYLPDVDLIKHLLKMMLSPLKF